MFKTMFKMSKTLDYKEFSNFFQYEKYSLSSEYSQKITKLCVQFDFRIARILLPSASRPANNFRTSSIGWSIKICRRCRMKRLLALILVSALIQMPALAIETQPEEAVTISAPNAVLMEKQTGEVIYAKNADEKVAPASVTKIMTILLIVEAIESGRITKDEMVTVSANASKIGGSHIFLAEGETMSVADLLKSIVVSSANDASVAMAEYLCGSEESFASRMNARAAELGMQNTNFNNCTGLNEDEGHYTTAMDVAIMSRELISHEGIRDLTTIWMDTIRNGEFGLNNTNKLLKRYEGCTGLKTGFTSIAGHCLSATAERAGVEYIAVVMGCASSDERFDSAMSLLNYGFANYSLAEIKPTEAIRPVRVVLGYCGSLQPVIVGGSTILLEKGKESALEYTLELAESVDAPVAAGQVVGKLRVSLEGKTLSELDLISETAIERMTPVQIFMELVSKLYG